MDTFGHIVVWTIYTSHIDHFTPQHTAYEQSAACLSVVIQVKSFRKQLLLKYNGDIYLFNHKKHRLWALKGSVSLSTHNLCFFVMMLEKNGQKQFVPYFW